MTFEEAMKHVQDGTATIEEREFVKSQLLLADAALGAQSAFNFDEAVRHVRDGSATEEEKRFVKKRLMAASDALSGRPKLNFEEALAHVQDGTATDEEKAFVKREVEEIDSLIDDGTRGEDMPIAAASREQVKRAKKSFKWRYIVIPFCTIIAIIATIGAILGGVFGYAASSAKEQMKFDRIACVNVAKQYTEENFFEIFHFGNDINDAPVDASIVHNMQTKEADRHLRYNGNHLADSYYVFEVRLTGKFLTNSGRHPSSVEIKVRYEVDTRTGGVRLISSDYDVDD